MIQKRGKVFKAGRSRAITLPYFWLQMIEEREDAKVIEVAVKMGEDYLLVEPIFGDKK